MAEKILRYRVELDDADLAQQLEAIRGKINGDITSMTSSINTQGAFDTSQIYNAPLNFTPPALPSEYNYPTVTAPAPSFQMVANAKTGFNSISSDFQNIKIGAQQLKSDVTSTFDFLGGIGQNFNDGFQMMKSDLNLSPVSEPEPGFFKELAAGVAGVGYDPRMPMYKSDYKSFYMNEASNTGKDILGFGIEAGVAVGAPALASFAIGGAAAATFVGAPLAAIGALTAFEEMDKEALDKDASKIMAYMSPTVKNVSLNDGRFVANSLKTFEDSAYAEIMDINKKDIEATMASFAASGGYTSTFSPEQFTQKTREMLENFRSLVHALGMAQEEAAGLMGELEAKKIASPANIGTFLAETQVQARSIGVSPMELIATGLQSTEFLKSAGYSPQNAYEFGVDAFVEAQRLANSADPYYKDAIYSVGGTAGATKSMIKNLIQYDNTPVGGLGTSNIYTTGDGSAGGASPPEQVDNASNAFTDPNQWYKYLYNKSDIEQSIGFTQKSQNLVNSTLKIMEPTGLDTSDPEVVAAFMSSYLQATGVDMTPKEASLIIGAASNVENPTKYYEKVKSQEYLNLLKEADPKLSDVLLYKLTPDLSLPKTGLGGMFRDAAASIWNAGEDIIDSATGRVRFHYEDYENISKETWDLLLNENFLEKYDVPSADEIKTIKSMERKLLNVIPSNKDEADKERSTKLLKLSNEDFNRTMLVLNEVYGNNLPTNVSDMNSIADYILDTVFEETPKGTQIKVADYSVVKDNLEFSKSLYDDGIISNLLNTRTEDKVPKNYIETSLPDINKAFEQRNFNYLLNSEDSAEDLYGYLSAFLYNDSFENLNKDTKTDLVRWVNSAASDKFLIGKDKFSNYDLPGLTVGTTEENLAALYNFKYSNNSDVRDTYSRVIESSGSTETTVPTDIPNYLTMYKGYDLFKYGVGQNLLEGLTERQFLELRHEINSPEFTKIVESKDLTLEQKSEKARNFYNESVNNVLGGNDNYTEEKKLALAMTIQDTNLREKLVGIYNESNPQPSEEPPGSKTLVEQYKTSYKSDNKHAEVYWDNKTKSINYAHFDDYMQKQIDLLKLDLTDDEENAYNSIVNFFMNDPNTLTIENYRDIEKNRAILQKTANGRQILEKIEEGTKLADQTNTPVGIGSKTSNIMAADIYKNVTKEIDKLYPKDSESEYSINNRKAMAQNLLVDIFNNTQSEQDFTLASYGTLSGLLSEEELAGLEANIQKFHGMTSYQLVNDNKARGAVILQSYAQQIAQARTFQEQFWGRGTTDQTRYEYIFNRQFEGDDQTGYTDSKGKKYTKEEASAAAKQTVADLGSLATQQAAEVFMSGWGGLLTNIHIIASQGNKKLAVNPVVNVGLTINKDGKVKAYTTSELKGN